MDAFCLRRCPSANAAAAGARSVPWNISFVRWVLPRVYARDVISCACDLCRSLAPAAGGAVDQVGGCRVVCGREPVNKGSALGRGEGEGGGGLLRTLQRTEASARIVVLLLHGFLSIFFLFPVIFCLN